MPALRISWACVMCVGATLVAVGVHSKGAGAQPTGADGLPSVPVIQLANTTHSTLSDNSGLTSMFSPRMDFEQWKPLTGRGDPLRNDPTYDYEPPVLERVHYWADERRTGPPRAGALLRPERDHRPEPSQRPEREPRPHAKAELLMLGVTSRKPSAAPVSSVGSSVDSGPSVGLTAARPPGLHYEDYTYKLSAHYPMTILVPPPPPAPAPAPLTPAPPSTLPPAPSSTLYALQESNLIYQSSSTHSWTGAPTLTSDYTGWGPTDTPLGAPQANDSYNLISGEHSELAPHPYVFYKPMLSEAPPPPRDLPAPVMIPTFLATVLPPTPALEPTTKPATEPTERTTPALEQTETATTEPEGPTMRPEPSSATTPRDMLGPMMSMPLGGEPDTREDNIYAFASEQVQVFDEDGGRDAQTNAMQSTRPPQEGARPFYVDAQTARGPAWHTPGREPALTPPSYLIIQGHSKVKTYGSKPGPVVNRDTITNEIPKPVFTDQVKHLHVKKSAKKLDTTDVNRRTRPKSLSSLLVGGYGSIELQETELGIKYDVSDGTRYTRGTVEEGPRQHAGPLVAEDR